MYQSYRPAFMHLFCIPSWKHLNISTQIQRTTILSLIFFVFAYSWYTGRRTCIGVSRSETRLCSTRRCWRKRLTNWRRFCRPAATLKMIGLDSSNSWRYGTPDELVTNLYKQEKYLAKVSASLDDTKEKTLLYISSHCTTFYIYCLLKLTK